MRNLRFVILFDLNTGIYQKAESMFNAGGLACALARLGVEAVQMTDTEDGEVITCQSDDTLWDSIRPMVDALARKASAIGTGGLR